MICIDFNKELYSKKAIEKSAQIYKDWAIFKISDLKDAVKVYLSAKDKNEEEYIKDEFCNYVLVLTSDIKL